MILTALELRRIEIATWRAQHQATLEQTAEQFDLSVSAISAAEKWYRDNRLHNLEAYERLKECRAEKRKHLKWLESQIRATKRFYRTRFKKPRPAPFSAIAQFSREWNRTHTAIAELDGLINRVLNVNVGGVDGNELSITLHTENGGD